MDDYRRSGDPLVFERLVEFVRPQLLARVRSRLHHLGSALDPQEILQDTIINIYRYPDRFDASRPGAFAAWSATIVDNTIWRQLRKRRSGPELALSPVEVLAQHADQHEVEPARAAQDHEECERAVAAFRLLLAAYLDAFLRLGERERFVLQMVEIHRLRYADLAVLVGIRPEALKMVVFRARKRIFEHMSHAFEAAGARR